MLKTKLWLIFSIIFLSNFIIGNVSIQAASINGKQISSQGACVMDYETGEILYEYNGNVPRVPASMTKIMNMYCAYEALENGEITLDTIVPISQNVYEKSRNRLYQSVLPLNRNENYTVDEIMDVTVVHSASGASVALAELIGGGSEAAFVERMNKKVAEMGIDAYYYDSCGIAENEISPIAMATLARNIIKDYPDILERSSKTSVNFHGNRYGTTDYMLLNSFFYDGLDGLKTGSTAAAKYCFCGTAVRNGRRIISVTMASSSRNQSFIDSSILLDYGFAIAAERYDTAYFTDIHTFINETEIPTLARLDESQLKTLIFTKDLRNYGFDVDYDDTNHTVIITYNKDKEFSPLSTENYKGKNMEKAFSIIPNNDIKIFLNDGLETYELKDIYNIDGYTCVAVNELREIYNVLWNNEENATYIQVSYKEPDTEINQITSNEENAVLPNGEKLTSKSAYIMDFATGQELYAFDENTQRPVASIAKMMAVYVMLDALKNGEINLDDVVPISENVYQLSREENYKMMVNLEYDEKYTVDEMLDMIVIDSAAACVTAMTELISGSEETFVERMNEKAKEIGINSVFYNGTGVCLNPETDKENLMSAKEVAQMTRRMIQDYPEILQRTKRASVNFHGKTYYNLNKMFTDYYYEGADGFKNGMTEASGYCMCGTAQLNGQRVITVTLPSESNEARFTDTAKLFDYGFAQLGVNKEVENISLEHIFNSDDEININIDGNYEMTFSEQQPFIINGLVMVPIQELMETLEKTVTLDPEKEQIVIQDEITAVQLSTNSDIMIKETKNPLTNEVIIENIQLKTNPVMQNKTIYMSLKELVEAFGATVIWDSEEKMILIIANVC